MAAFVVVLGVRADEDVMSLEDDVSTIEMVDDSAEALFEGNVDYIDSDPEFQDCAEAEGGELEEGSKVDAGDGEMAFGVESIETQSFMAVKPWIGAIVEPTGFQATHDDSAPDSSLVLEWVHGYRCRDARSNVMALDNGCVAWPSAGVGIVYNPEAHTQMHHIDHTDDVISMAMHPNGVIIASGGIQVYTFLADFQFV